MKLGIPVYEGVDLLDVAGPYEMFKWVDREKGLEALILSEDGRPVTSGNGVRFEAHSSFAATPTLDVLWVPGGTPKALQEMMLHPDPLISPTLRAWRRGRSGSAPSVRVRCCWHAPASLMDIRQPPTGRSSNVSKSFRRLSSTRPISALLNRETGLPAGASPQGLMKHLG
jgi:hypothetical protein